MSSYHRREGNSVWFSDTWYVTTESHDGFNVGMPAKGIQDIGNKEVEGNIVCLYFDMHRGADGERKPRFWGIMIEHEDGSTNTGVDMLLERPVRWKLIQKEKVTMLIDNICSDCRHECRKNVEGYDECIFHEAG